MKKFVKIEEIKKTELAKIKGGSLPDPTAGSIQPIIPWPPFPTAGKIAYPGDLK